LNFGLRFWRRAVRHPLVVLACAAAVSSPLQALNDDKLFLRGTTSINYDSNVFRIADDISDDIANRFLQGKDRSDLICRSAGSASAPTFRRRNTSTASSISWITPPMGCAASGTGGWETTGTGR
jgi:hypothetical protein